MRFVLAAVFLAAQFSGAFADQLSVNSAVDSATVYLSGAEVTRLAKVHLEKGAHTVVISDVPASAVPGSIRVEGKATGKLEIGSVNTTRKFLQRAESREADANRKTIEDQIEQLKDQKSAFEAQAQAARTQSQLIANLAELPKHPAPPAPPGTLAPADDWQKVLSLIVQATSDASKLALDARQKIRDYDRKITDLKKQLASLAPAKTEQTEVTVRVNAQSPLDADLTVRYHVPDAHWTPIYDARLETGTKTQVPKLELMRRAAITQKSGEDWTDVALALSTARPSDGSFAPTIESQFVDYPEPPQPVAQAAGAAPAPTSRRLKAAPPLLAEQDAAQAARDEVPEMPASEIMTKLKGAAFDATFAVAGRTTVVGNGEIKRVLLMSENIEPTLSDRSVPRLDTNAYLYAKIKIAKGTPLLPGTVYLFRDGTFAGTGEMPLLRPGQEHDLGFGIDDQVKVKHEVLEEKRGEAGLISTSHVDSRNFRVTVKNLHERPIDVTVLDRVPVSRNEEIKVEYSGVSPTTQNVDGKRGVISFAAHLEPDEEKTLDYGYRVSWPAAKSVYYTP
jgi:uncharacterized protein (TIGR02231 family)